MLKFEDWLKEYLNPNKENILIINPELKKDIKEIPKEIKMENNVIVTQPVIKNYFTIAELTKSDTAQKYHIDNTPNAIIISNLNRLIVELNKFREAWGTAITVNSGYRCPAVNSKVGGSTTSAHLTGNAVDLWPVNGKFNEFVAFAKNYWKDKKFDQLIVEKSSTSRWLHLGLFNNSGLQRKQIFNLNV